MKKLKSFTLVELVVVMAIIGFLSVSAFAGYSYALRKSRDTRRINAIRTFNQAVMSYYADENIYPACSSSVSVTGVDGNTWNKCAIDNQGTLTFTDLTPYFDGDWASPLGKKAESVDTGAAYAYYYDGDQLSYAVCTLLENKKGGNVTPVNATVAAKYGCFCVGTAASKVACAGLTNPNGDNTVGADAGKTAPTTGPIVTKPTGSNLY